MEIEKTPIYREIIQVFRGNDQLGNIGWKATIHLNDAGDRYNPIQVLAVNIKRDYVKSFSDEVTCTLVIPLGKYARKVYPNRNNLQITLYRTTLLESTGEIDYDAEIEAERYSATLIDDGSAPTEMKGTETNDEYSLDLLELKEVNFQLFNKAIEKIRLTTVGGIYRKVKTDDLLKTLITKTTETIKVDDKRAIVGVDLIKANNDKQIEQLIISQGIKLIDVADYVQTKYGVYNAGIGSFIQNSNWFVYPLYDTTRFEKTVRTLTIYVLPKRKFPQIERTYRKKGDALIILCTSETDFKDDSGMNYLNEGNGVRLADSGSMIETKSKTVNNKTKMSRGGNNTELLSDKKKDGINYAPMGNNRITSNPYTSFSKLAGNKGGMFKANWENSRPTLIEPGMISKIVYFDEDEIKEVYGTVLGASHVSTKIGDFGSHRHVTNSMLLLFVNAKVS